MPRRKLWKFEKWTMHSKFEYNIAFDLRSKDVDFDYEAETFSYTVDITHSYCPTCGSKPSCKDARYTPDFFLPNGIVVESKGKWTSQDRKKMAAMIEQHPDLDLRMLFQADNWITKSHSSKYSTWCERKGIPYAVGRVIPEEWINE